METIIGSPLIAGLEEEKYILSLLKHIFRAEPKLEFLKEIKDIPEINEEKKLDKELNLIIRAVKKNQGRLAEFAEELAIEFARLFIGPKKPPAVPFASFYLSETKTVMSEITTYVRKKYLEAGMAVKNLYSVPEDSIGIELEFIFYLSVKIGNLYENGNEDEASRLFEMKNNFLNEHMALWVPAFADKILLSTQEDFYKGAAAALHRVIQHQNEL
jgi:TorA maturation chaperone TorD